MEHQYKIIVIGGGHAGCEAALIASKLGVPVMMITLNKAKIGEMSCNPSIGGVGKGQLVKEIDALGGEMGRCADWTGIHFKQLNTKKGSAVVSSRCQSDKVLYQQRMQATVESHPLIKVLEGEVKELVVSNQKITGLKVKKRDGEIEEILSEAVIITSGTFLSSQMHTGKKITSGGRVDEPSSEGLSQSLRNLGLKTKRLKTGTPARLKRQSLDFSLMEPQPGDAPPKKFSFWDSEITQPQILCYLSFTNEKTHQIIQENIQDSPLFSGQITGIGPRYCPSIEDKVFKFKDKTRHQVFFEPESLHSDLIYPNGISTSLPKEVQEAFIKTIRGCEKAEIVKFGYAVEYDAIEPDQLKKTLETRLIEGLYIAGQMNGTSGYEEAAAQGLMAGINAALKIKREPEFILERNESYIGVMIDDLVHFKLTEPYRMFTSRVEYRLSIREDNADIRLSQKAFQLGLINESQIFQVTEKIERINSSIELLKKTFIKLNQESIQASKHLKKPEVSLLDLKDYPALEDIFKYSLEIQNRVETEIKFEGYIQMQKEEIEKVKKLSYLTIPEAIDYQKVEGLSYELKEKLTTYQPKKLSEVYHIPGMTPAGISSLLFYVRKSVNEL